MEINLEVLQSKKDELVKQLEQLKINAQAISGALQMLEHLMQIAKTEVAKLEDGAKLEIEKLVGK